MQTLAGKKILLGISGGIAAYKCAELTRRLIERGAQVQVVMTKAAKPTKEVDYNVGYTSIAKGDATFLAVGWFPLHADKYTMSGGDDKFFRKGQYVSGAAQVNLA